MKSQVSGFYLPILTKIQLLIPWFIPSVESLVETTNIPCMGWHSLPVVLSFLYHTPSPLHSAKCSPRDLFISKTWLCHFLLKAAQRPAVALSREHLFLTSFLILATMHHCIYTPPASDDFLFQEYAMCFLCPHLYTHSVSSAGTVSAAFLPPHFFPLSLKNPTEIVKLMGSCLGTFFPRLSCLPSLLLPLCFFQLRGFSWSTDTCFQSPLSISTGTS